MVKPTFFANAFEERTMQACPENTQSFKSHAPSNINARNAKRKILMHSI